MSSFLLDYCSNKLNWDGKKAFIIYLYAPHTMVTSRIQKRENEGSRLGRDIENGQINLASYDRIFGQIFSSIQRSESLVNPVKILKIENGNDSAVICAKNIIKHLKIQEAL